MTWDPSKHPRAPQDVPTAGQFINIGAPVIRMIAHQSLAKPSTNAHAEHAAAHFARTTPKGKR